MSAGYTPYGVPVYGHDFSEWTESDGYLWSPTCIADRAAHVAESRMSGRLTAVERAISDIRGRMALRCVPVLGRSSTIADVKDAVNGIRKGLSGALVLLVAMLSFSSQSATNAVYKINANDLGDTNVVVGIEFGDTIPATNLTAVAEMFDDVATGRSDRVTSSFSNAVRSVGFAPGGGIASVVPEGTNAVVLRIGSGSVVAESSSGGLQNRIDVGPVVRIRDLQDVWIGGSNVGDRVVGGETLFARISRGGGSGTTGPVSSITDRDREYGSDLGVSVKADSTVTRVGIVNGSYGGKWVTHVTGPSWTSNIDGLELTASYNDVTTTASTYKDGPRWFVRVMTSYQTLYPLGISVRWDFDSRSWVVRAFTNVYELDQTTYVKYVRGSYSDTEIDAGQMYCSTSLDHPFNLVLSRVSGGSESVGRVLSEVDDRIMLEGTHGYVTSISGLVSSVSCDRSYYEVVNSSTPTVEVYCVYGTVTNKVCDLVGGLPYTESRFSAKWDATGPITMPAGSPFPTSAGATLFIFPNEFVGSTGFYFYKGSYSDTDVLESISDTTLAHCSATEWSFKSSDSQRTYLLRRKNPWSRVGTIALDSLVPRGVSATNETSGGFVNVVPYYSGGEVKWRLAN